MQTVGEAAPCRLRGSRMLDNPDLTAACAHGEAVAWQPREGSDFQVGLVGDAQRVNCVDRCLRERRLTFLAADDRVGGKQAAEGQGGAGQSPP